MESHLVQDKPGVQRPQGTCGNAHVRSGVVPQKTLTSFFLCLFILRHRERERERHEQGRGRERRKGKSPRRLHAVSTEPDVGLNHTNREITTRAKIKSQMLNRLSHPGALTALTSDAKCK